MCGIIGLANLNSEPVNQDLLWKMTDVMAHRGPDGRGQYLDREAGLGHRRLAIIDLSPAGHQPMSNETGDVYITYNGEIYNFKDLRVELESLGHKFRSRTDTEVIVHAYEEWGESCVSRFNGMFAFAIWDSLRKRFFLARDRYGIKPLYWYLKGSLFIFASEIKAILLHPCVKRDVCYPALNEYFTFQNIFSDLTLFQDVRLLPPGCTLTFSIRGSSQPLVHQYWDYSWNKTVNLSEHECVDRLSELFIQATTRQLVSDVPVGTYLSGGMDSGSITAVAIRHLPHLTTFTCGFDLSSASGLEMACDERANAEVLSNLFKTEHYEVVAHAGDMEWVLPNLIWHLEDLRIGQSYPNYLVARLASKFVKVVLSGGGGDELFAGYPWRYYRGLNSTNREDYLRRYYQFWQRLVSDEDKPQLFTTQTLQYIGEHSSFDVFRNVFKDWSGPFTTNEDYMQASLYFELKTFLHGLLTVEDKLSMAHSLETRVPFLDNDLVDFAMQIPVSYKLLNLERTDRVDENLIGKRLLYERETRDGKMILRKAMSRLMPLEITERVKQGFSAPDASWFRGESIDYIHRLLRDRRARIYEFVTPSYVKRKLDEHTSGQYNHRLFIWSLLSFEWWLRKFMQ